MSVHKIKPFTLLKVLLVAGLLGQPVSSSAAPSTASAHTLVELRSRLDDRLNSSRFRGALWGVQIVELKTGKPVYACHADRLMSPASNSKLYTAALALDTLGGDYRIRTPVYATVLPDDSGRLQGDLILSGRGDPSWKAVNFGDNFSPFISVLTNAGVRSITGDLVMDDTFFRGPSTGGGWCVDDLSESYGAEVSALSLEDNLTPLRVTPGQRPGEACQLEVVRPDTHLAPINRIQTIAPGGSKRLEVYRVPGSMDYYVLGQMPAGGGEEEIQVPVPEPALWFGTALKSALIQSGIAVRGTVRTVAWPEAPPWNQTNLVKLGDVGSPPLRDLIRGFMKPSQNLEADLIFDHVGECSRKLNSPAGDYSERLAVTALQTFLSAKGIPAAVHFEEGSGLSRNNLTSAAATAALLVTMATNRWAADFMDALPIAGVDGTLRHRLRNPRAARNVRAKTGTLRWANSLSGYVTTAAGDQLAFSLMLNRFDPPAGANPADELDAIAVLLADYDGPLEQ